MPSVNRKKPDPVVPAIRDALAIFQKKHPQSVIDVRRQDNFTVWVRIIDASFRRKNLARRHDEIMTLLDNVPPDFMGDVSMLLLLTPDEAMQSQGSYEFDHPHPMPQ